MLPSQDTLRKKKKISEEENLKAGYANHKTSIY